MVTFSPVSGLLGYDVMWYWGHYMSIISDTLVRPFWHPPDPSDLSELAAHARSLNEHVLFPAPEEAERFIAYYRTRPWAEAESPAGFCVVQVSTSADLS